jgi:hypothetical protein
MALPIKNPLNSLGLTSAPGSLQAFYNKIGSNTTLTKDNYVNYINVPKFFDVSIKNIRPISILQQKENIKELKENNKKDFLQLAEETVTNIWESVVDNFEDNQSFDAFINKTIVPAYKKDRNTSLIKTISKYINVDLETDLKYYVQSIKLPSIKMDVEYISNFSGVEALAKDGVCVIPENNTISLSILDTASPLHEYLFYPWMTEAALPQWTYTSMPFTKADIYIDFMFPNYTSASDEEDNNMINGAITKGLNALSEKAADYINDDPLSKPSFRYIFKNCYPTSIELINPSQTISNTFTRNIDFTFSHILISVSGITTLSASKKLLNSLSNRVVNPLTNKGLQPITGNSFVPSTSL